MAPFADSRYVLVIAALLWTRCSPGWMRVDESADGGSDEDDGRDVRTVADTISTSDSGRDSMSDSGGDHTPSDGGMADADGGVSDPPDEPTGNALNQTQLFTCGDQQAYTRARIRRIGRHESTRNTGNALGSMAGSDDTVSLEQKAALVLGLSSKITGGGHSTNAGALSSTRSGAGAPAGHTIDHLLSTIDAVRNGAPFPAVRLGVVGEGTRLNYATCAYGPKKPAPITCDAISAFNSLFGSVAKGAGKQAFRERKDLLNFAVRDVERALNNFSGNSTERQKLERPC